MKHGRHGKTELFTLIELLIVISVIAILLSILLPALGNARAKAFSLSCMGNLKHLALGCGFYSDDNNDGFPPVGAWGGQVAPTARWDGSLGAYVGGVVWPQVLGRKMFVCLSVPAGEAAAIPDNYIYNQQLAVYRRATINRPSKLVVIADGYNDTELFKGAADWHSTLIEKLATLIPRRHNNGLNYLFSDGHVAWHRNTSEIEVGN